MADREADRELDREHAEEALVTLRARVDAHFEAAMERSPGQLACRAGCFDCCRAGLSVFGIEADRIREALASLSADVRERVRAQGHDEGREHCALLLDGRCSVYGQRPILCRSHGLAVRVPAEAGEDPTRPRLEHCPLNYTSQTPPAASVLSLDAVNRPLSVMAAMWGGERVELARLAREG